MPALAPPVTDERNSLREFLAYHQSAYFAVSYGLTDEQARSSPSVSALSIGGLVKHATAMQHSWMTRVAAAPDAPPKDTRPFEEIAREFGDQHVMGPDATLPGLLEAFGFSRRVWLSRKPHKGRGWIAVAAVAVRHGVDLIAYTSLALTTAGV